MLIGDYGEIKTFEDLKTEIIDVDLCAGCGTCAAFCEAIEMDGDTPKMVGDCVLVRGALKCGTCYTVCPKRSNGDATIIEKFLSREKRDELFGNYVGVYAVKATNQDIVAKAQDGGAVSAIIHHLLSTGAIDCGVISQRDEKWRASPLVVTAPEDVTKGSGTRYAVSPNVEMLGEVIKDEKLRVAIVGTPCQVKGVRNLQSKLLEVIEDIEILNIGLFCTENFRYDSFIEYMTPRLEEGGLRIEDVTKTEITKGKFFFRSPKGDVSLKIAELEPIIPTNCRNCIDFSAELADISVGSVGAPNGWSTVITRNSRSDEIVKKMIEEGLFEVQDVNIKIVHMLCKNKRKRLEKEEAGE
ncbi:MAG: coenzyme F420-reducing hydrogenase subunit beta [Candidatus Syntrophoarchaeum caldarius]|uniref:Coenzyme F420-reducing hydrogenase subunit beta n=1 Tax=Candidatus Syntropharchaeum caldarium TaxID=1838285 RepID=A0A1F2PB30_9EURY|nr:MAG: coenzyme F420-reducing hydrogenase subunit beta [Candidatus Syntrophoarchaeum caldarius]